ncbi:hypothetical protein OAH77_04330 [Flavobacteriaceae bacterium]|nr:hypothetical protein [Flavobacteriaceae bacterium]
MAIGFTSCGGDDKKEVKPEEEEETPEKPKSFAERAVGEYTLQVEVRNIIQGNISQQTVKAKETSFKLNELKGIKITVELEDKKLIGKDKDGVVFFTGSEIEEQKNGCSFESEGKVFGGESFMVEPTNIGSKLYEGYYLDKDKQIILQYAFTDVFSSIQDGKVNYIITCKLKKQ